MPSASRASAMILVGVFALLAVSAAAQTTPPAPGHLGHADDSAPVELGSALDSWLLSGLPSGREPWSLLRTAEAACVADRIESGGLFLGVPALLGVHGASWTDTAWQLGEVEITDPARGGAPLVIVPAEAIARVSLTTALAPSAFTGAGPRLSLAPRRAENAWHGDLAFYTTPFTAEGGTAVAPPIARARAWDDVSLSGGGPALREGFWIFGAVRGTRARREERGTGDALETSTLSALLHAVYAANPRDEWRLLAAASASRLPFSGRARLLDPAEREDHRALHLQAGFARRAEVDATPWRATVAYSGGHETPPTAAPATVAVERLRDGPVPELYAAETRARRLDATARVTPRFLRFGGERNQATAGVDFERASASWTPAGWASAGTTAERVGGVPARVWDFGLAGQGARAHATHLALFVDDRLALSRTIAFEAGLRGEAWRGNSDTGPGHVRWTTLSPRAAARWQPVRALALFGGWERVHPRLTLRTLWWGDPHAPQGRVYRWNDDGDRVYQANERGPLVSLLGPGAAAASLDPDLQAPRTQGVIAGFDVHPGAGWTVRFAGVRRRARDLLESVEIGLSPADYRTSFVADPAIDVDGPADDRLLPIFSRQPSSFGREQQVLTNAPGLGVLHEGVELVVEKQLGAPFFMRIGGTASRSTGAGGNRGFSVLENDPGVVGELADDPNADTYASGRLFFDRAYTLKIAGLWRPRAFSLGVVANYQDGQPFARMVLARDLPQGAEAIAAIRRSEHRFTYTLTLDARLARVFRVGDTSLELSLEAFNLLDMQNEVEEDVVGGPGFRTVTAVQPPRSVRVGVRLRR